MYADRLPLYRQLEEERASKVIALINGDRPGLATQLHPETLDHLIHHLDRIGVVPRITLVLYTCGGDTLTAWSIVQLVRQFCSEFEVLVPAKARSSGTLICLGADRLVMTKQATLGPIDPTVYSSFSPHAAADPRVPLAVSVEEINGFLELARTAIGTSEAGMIAALAHLAGQVHPLVLGNAYRSRMQIRTLAKRLVRRQIEDETKIEALVEFLCGGAGSHDYTIFRGEALALGLRVESPSLAGYGSIKFLYEDIRDELELTTPLNPSLAHVQGEDYAYRYCSGLLESVECGSHQNLDCGTLRWAVRPSPAAPRTTLQDDKTFQGWRHDEPTALRA